MKPQGNICKNLFNNFFYIIIYLKVAKNYTYLFRIKIKYFAFADKKKENTVQLLYN